MTCIARHPLCLAIVFAIPTIAWATDDHVHHEAATQLDEIVVTASPLAGRVEDLARPVEVLAGEALDGARRSTLGDTVSGLPGVQGSFFGPGVGRPIIRGLDGARVQVLGNGLSSLDVSTVSVDHATTIEPFLADQIEVLKGPANLFFGSGAIGGAVNVVDSRIPDIRAEKPLSGRAELRAGTADGERAAMFRLDGGRGAFAWHVDALDRNTDDINIPGFAYSAGEIAEALEDGETSDELARGEVPNTGTDTRAASAGASLIGERGFIGASISRHDSNYGIPAGAHAHHDEPTGMAIKGADDGEVRLDLGQTRTEINGALNGLGPFQRVSLRATGNDYEHVELEGAEIGTRFINDAVEARIEAVQEPIAGWDGAIGLQFGRRDFEAIGDEAFVPASDSSDLGLFLLQKKTFGKVTVELGARHDDIEVDLADDSAGRDFSATSLSAGLRWSLADGWAITLNADHAERAPTAEELFSDGPHIATASYELGDATLDEEVARRAEIGLHFHDDSFDLHANLFRTSFDDFIYLADTGLEEDELPVRQWTAADARFTGWELEGRVQLTDGPQGAWSLRGFADGVRGTLAEGGGNLPRIAPNRFGLGVEWQRDGWRAGSDVLRVEAQDRVATGEDETPGYTFVNAQLSYHWDSTAAGWEIYLQGRNLGNQEARVHTSFLKDYSPLLGRHIAGGLRVFF